MCLGENDQWYLIGQNYGYDGQCGYTISYFTRISYVSHYIEETIDRLEGIELFLFVFVFCLTEVHRPDWPLQITRHGHFSPIFGCV